MSVLHELTLPHATYERLKDVVLLQIELLTYASSTETPKRQACADYLNKKSYKGCFSSRGQQIANWFFQSNATKRQGLLKNFATAYQDGIHNQQNQLFRRQWLQRISQEIQALLDQNDAGNIIIGSFYVEEKEEQSCKKTEAPAWQQKAGEFFLYFYENYLGTDETFSSKIFSEDNKEFGRQKILQLFIEKNSGLEICAVCDEARYYTQGQKKIHSILDHYFPKDIYPHLACHPYNLIPVCYACNSSVKGTKDPFINQSTNERFTSLPRKALPYHRNYNPERPPQIYLEVAPGQADQMITIGEIKVAQNGALTDPALQVALDLLQNIYQLPDRWSHNNQSIRIHDILFRRIRHYLNDGKGIQNGIQGDIEVHHALSQLLYYLAQEDQRRDPFGFALTWMLGAYLKEREKQGASDQTQPSPAWKALIAEIQSWSEQSLEDSTKRSAFVSSLLEMLL